MTVPPDSTDYTQSGGVKDAAQDQAQNVASTARSEASDVAQTAKEQVQNVTADVREQTRQLADEARGQLTEHASSQRDKAVESLRSLADDLSSMAEKAEGSGLGVQLAKEGGEVTHKAADFLEQRDPTQLLDEVRDLARRRPGAFLVGAAIAGVVVGRLARGARSAQQSDAGSDEASYQQTYPSTFGQTYDETTDLGAPAGLGAPVAAQGYPTEAGIAADYGIDQPAVQGTSYQNPQAGDAW